MNSVESGPIGIETTARSPWLTIWTSPRVTIRRIIVADPTHQVRRLAALNGVAEALGRAAGQSLGDRISLLVLLLLCAVLGSLAGIVALYVFSALLRWTGRWLGGQAEPDEVRAAVAWGWAPSIFALLLWIPQLALYGDTLFGSGDLGGAELQDLPLPFLALSIAQGLTGPWGSILLIACLSEVQRFSVWRSLLSWLLVVLLFAAPVACLLEFL